PTLFLFAWRIWNLTNKLTKHLWCPSLIVLLGGVVLTGGLYTAAHVSIIKLFAHKPELHTGALVEFLASSAADVHITAALVLTLSNRKTAFATTDGVIDCIIRSASRFSCPPSRFFPSRIPFSLPCCLSFLFMAFLRYLSSFFQFILPILSRPVRWIAAFRLILLGGSRAESESESKPS
ncbi:hypothetical protein B0H11DRAFT_1743706, partial [Mycena galericulata]